MDPGPSRRDGGSPKQQAWPSALADALEVVPAPAVSMEVDPISPDEIPGGSPKQAWPSALGDVLDVPPLAAVSIEVEPRPDEISGSGELPLALPQVVPSPALDEKVTAVGVGGASSSSSSSMAPPAGGHQDLAMVVADTRIQTVGAANDGFVPISDVKAMLQTGRFEGQQVAYKNKRTKLNLLHGTIHGTTYFCSCGDDCGHNGKALSARAFELHAVKNGKETHNPNDHIVLSTSNITLFEACRRLKEAKNEAVQEAIFDTIMKGDHGKFPKENVKAPVTKMSHDDKSNLTALVHNLVKRMESTEKRMENLQSQVNTIEKNIDFFCNEMVRYQALFQDVSKSLGKFVNDM